MEENEGLAVYVTQGTDSVSENYQAISKVVADGAASELVLYELIGRRQPVALFGLTRKFIERIAAYVDRYH